MAINRRGKILINKPFQLRFSLYVCSWLIAVSVIYPVTTTSLFNYMITAMSTDPHAPQVANLFKARDEFIKTLLFTQLTMNGAIFIISLFMSHRIAGPLLKLKRYFNEARDGKLDQKLQFRKTDYFLDLVPAYNDMMTAIGGRIAQHQQLAADAIPRIEKVLNQCSPEAQRELKEVLASLRDAQNA